MKMRGTWKELDRIMREQRRDREKLRMRIENVWIDLI